MAYVISGCILSIVWNKSKNSIFSFFPSKINVFLDTGLSCVTACGHCWVAIPAIASTRQLMVLFVSEFWFLGVCPNIRKLLSCDTCFERFWCWCDGGLRGVKVCPIRNWGIWFVCVVFPLPCDECAFAGQNVSLGPTTHFPRPEYYVESHHLHFTRVVYCRFQMRFQKGH